MKKVLFLPFTCLITLSLEKKLLFWKKSGKSLELDPKICTNPAHSVSKFNPLDKDTLLMWRLRGPLESVHSNVHFYQLT